ncbi:MAG: isoprenylcysteine carboxylmethyltransferase family protein [Sedimentisphaerales bacterium]|nr:isoprenylcysteine carboxylmethyltransferase family protein [Sedimentisphaerales bacterium]
MTARPETPRTGKRMLPPAYLLLALAAMALLHLVLPLRQIAAFPRRLVGVLPVLLGFALNMTADARLKQRGTTVKPFENPASFVTTGVYRMTRNPMYLGFTLILLGVALLMGSLSAFFIIPPFAVVMEVVFIRKEERMMDAAFGGDWRAYRAKGRRWI